MSPERWRQIQDLFHRMLEKDGSQRAAFLNQACADDDWLRREVKSLVRHAGDEHFMTGATVDPESRRKDEKAETDTRYLFSNSRKVQRPPWWMCVVAASFVAVHALIPYLLIWGPADIVGLQAAFENGAMRIRALASDSPLSHAGLRTDDRVLAGAAVEHFARGSTA